jgi:hypothetical protein
MVAPGTRMMVRRPALVSNCDVGHDRAIEVRADRILDRFGASGKDARRPVSDGALAVCDERID